MIQKYYIYLIILFPIAGILSQFFLKTNINYTFGTISLFTLFIITFTNSSKLYLPKYSKYLFLFWIYKVGIDFHNHRITDILDYILKDKYLYFQFVVLCIENIKASSINSDKIERIIKIILIFAGVVSIIQFFKPLFFVYYSSDIQERVLGSTLYRIPSIYTWTGGLIGMANLSLFSLLLARFYQKKENIAITIFYSVIVGLTTFLTYTRWLMGGYLIILLIYFAYHKGNPRAIIRYALFISVLTISGTFAIQKIGVDLNTVISDRIVQSNNIEENSGYSRILAFQVFFKLFPQNYLFGRGAAVDAEIKASLQGRSSQVHVGYLSLLLYYGIIGAFLYFLFFKAFFQRFYYSSKRLKYWGPLFSLFIFLWANLTLVFIIPYDFGIFLSLVMLRIYEYEDLYEKNRPLIA